MNASRPYGMASSCLEHLWYSHDWLWWMEVWVLHWLILSLNILEACDQFWMSAKLLGKETCLWLLHPTPHSAPFLLPPLPHTACTRGVALSFFDSVSFALSSWPDIHILREIKKKIISSSNCIDIFWQIIVSQN